MPTERAKQVKKTDDAFREFILHRDGHRCVVPAAKHGGPIQCGHLFSRGNYAARWHEKNAAAQCAGCNNRHEHDWKPFETYMRRRWGTQAIDDLYAWWNRAVKLSLADLKDIEGYYKARLKGEMYGIKQTLKPYVGLR